MRTLSTTVACGILLSVAFCEGTMSSLALAQSDRTLPDATQLTLIAPMSAVTLYTERAMVTRSCALPNEQGIFEIRIEGLPKSIDGASLSARVEGGKLLDVRYESVVTAVNAATNPELLEALKLLEESQRLASTQALRMTKISDQNALLNAIASKTATETAKDFGSASLDPVALAKQVMYLDEARERLITARIELEAQAKTTSDLVYALTAKVKALGGQSKVARNAVISVGKSSIGSATLWIHYLVDSAMWAPEYAVRALDTGDDSTDALTIEYNAVITQASGEDWSDVALTLSTAQPTRNPAPPSIQAVFVDVFVEPAPADTWSKGGGAGLKIEPGLERFAAGSGGVIGDAGEDPERFGVELEKNFADAQAEGSVVVNYALPRKVSIPSDGARTQTKRIATVDLKPEFSHAARPIVDETVYLRAKTRNTSAYRFLEGTARLFVGDDSVGVTEFPTVSVGADMTFWLGGDPRITVARALVSQDSKEEGMFGKEAVTTWKWRVDFTSSAQGSARIELTDRIPVSRNAEIKIELKDLSMPLSTDAEYLKAERPRGMLQWLIDMNGLTKDGKPSKQSISWTVRRAHAKGVEIIETDDEDGAE